MSTRERRDRSDKADRDLSSFFIIACQKNNISTEDISLIAVGGYGRGELSKGSDLDITVIYKNQDLKLENFASELLYPIWDQGISVDHSIRHESEFLKVAASDLKVLLGALDMRHIAGSVELTNISSQKLLKIWKTKFKKLYPELKKNLTERIERSGELAFLLEPDLKEARGGLRDITILKAIAKLGKFKVPLEKISASETLIQNVRDALHSVMSKPRDQLLLIEQDKVAKELSFKDADELMLQISKAARSVDYIFDGVIHSIDLSLKRFSRKKAFVISEGLVVRNNEIDFTENLPMVNNSEIGLKAAAAAAQRGLLLSQDAVSALAINFEPLRTPWNRSTREDLISIIGAGKPMLKVIETLDQENLISKWIPEWEHVRFLPQRNVLHRHTVDRHMLETAVEAANLTRTVRRPDLLLFAALFHDIGKGYENMDHSEYGAQLITSMAKRAGFPQSDVQILQFLVREHLTLSTAATRRDLDDPQTILDVVAKVENQENLHLLHALSIADAKATGKTAWSDWKAKLLKDLVVRCELIMAGEIPVAPPDLEIPSDYDGELKVIANDKDSILELEIIAKDQVGLLSAIAGVLSINRLELRNAKTKTIGEFAIGKWLVSPDINSVFPGVAKLEDQISRAIKGELDLQRRIDERIENYRRLPGILTPDPVVSATNDIATNATVLEIRMHDRPGILYSVAKSISRSGLDIKAVVVSTLGAEAFDTLYITTAAGEPLSEERAKLLANQVETALITYR